MHNTNVKAYVGSWLPNDGTWGDFGEGTVDEVQLYNKTLTSSEINQLYHGGLHGALTLNASQTDTGDEWYVTFRAYNATTNGTLYTSNTVTIT